MQVLRHRPQLGCLLDGKGSSVRARCSRALPRHMENSVSAEEEIQVSFSNAVATVVLNRPKALNALSTHMVERLSHLLGEWSSAVHGSHNACAAVIIKGSGTKAFCAGGDIKWVVEQMGLGRREGPIRFFTSEYQLNYQIAVCPVPYIALMDGVVMGGGAGVSVHGHFKVVTERTVFAMPECGIGLYPDIGASSFLTRLPGHLGMYLGLTGARLEGVDVRVAGLATHYIPSRLLPEVEVRLQQLGAAHLARSSGPLKHVLDLSEVNIVLCELEQEAGALPQGRLKERLPWIDQHFAGFSPAAIIESLRARDRQLSQLSPQQQGLQPEADWVKETLQALSRGSPLSQCITSDLFRRTQHLTLQECLQLDIKLVQKFLTAQSDFAEGVRATLLERGRPPAWKFPQVQEVPAHVVQSFFDDADQGPKFAKL